MFANHFSFHCFTVRRGSEEGPWTDGIPFDGREVWQFALALNDHKENMWIVQPNSFRNLGRCRHPRCWPWSNGNELPYEHTGVDSSDINECYELHVCVGPFGCDGNDHSCSYNFAGAA